MKTLGRVVALGLAVVGTMAAACAGGGGGASEDAPFEVLARYPHDSAAYTQGLVWDDSVLLESTGQYGKSDLRRVNLKTGQVLQSVRLADNRFGEGLVKVKDRLYQLTWESGVGYIYDAATLARVDSFTYKGEGWGLATDGASIYMSDGTDSLRILDPATLQQTRSLKVTWQGSPVPKLNELEWVNGEILANLYESDWIARIDPATGQVRQLLDFASLWPREKRTYGVDVFNGISLGPEPGTLLVTGKLWPTLYVVRLKPPKA